LSTTFFNYFSRKVVDKVEIKCNNKGEKTVRKRWD